MRVIVAGNRSWAKSLRWKSKYWQLCNRTELCCQLCISGSAHTHTQNKYHSTLTQTEKANKTHPPLPLSWVQPQSNSYSVTVTEKGWRGDGSVATGDHDADPGFHERDGEIDDLRTLLIDRQRSDGHDGFLIDHLWRAEEREGRRVKGREEGWMDEEGEWLGMKEKGGVRAGRKEEVDVKEEGKDMEGKRERQDCKVEEKNIGRWEGRQKRGEKGKWSRERKGERRRTFTLNCLIIVAFTVKGSEMLQAVNIINIPWKDTTSSWNYTSLIAVFVQIPVQSLVIWHTL